MEGRVSKDVDLLPEGYCILDVGKESLSSSEGLGEILADLRDQSKIQIPDHCKKIPSDSRFGLSAEEIDGEYSFVTKAVSGVLGLRPDEELTTPSCAVLNYYGNLFGRPGLGEGSVPEWLLNPFGRGGRLISVGLCGGVDGVHPFASSSRHFRVDFRLMIKFPCT